MAERISIAQGNFQLSRLPQRPRELLRAWDAADEYLLEQLAEQSPAPDSRVLIINDSFGALAVALHDFQPVALSDSYLSQAATRQNLRDNGLSEHSVTLLNSLAPLSGVFDLVLIKVPKTLALLEDEVLRLRPHIHAQTQIIVASMLKTLPSSVWILLEKHLGATQTSLAKKKARLIFVTPNLNLPPLANPYPSSYRLEHTDYTISNHANVFSRDSLDIGTRFFLQHLPSEPLARDIIDLGCGNGVVGLLAAERNPQATLHFVDESFMAVASAQDNFQRVFGENRAATFQVGDGLNAFAAQSADLILCNPPFHQNNTIGDQIAVSMFSGARRVLRQGGQLWVIGNRHLPYKVTLERLFGHCDQQASNAKFVILRTRRV
jgi:16S rRNA (guanine1207-N2)-methyltransferase